MKEAISNMPVVPLEPQWWLNHQYHGGVSKRVGWWTIEGKYRQHWYVVVFHDGTRSDTRPGTNPVEEI